MTDTNAKSRSAHLRRGIVLLCLMSLTLLAGFCRDPGSSELKQSDNILLFLSVQPDDDELIDVIPIEPGTYEIQNDVAGFRSLKLDSTHVGQFSVFVSASTEKPPGYQSAVPWGTASRLDVIHGEFSERKSPSGPTVLYPVEIQLDRSLMFLLIDPGDFNFEGWDLQGYYTGKAPAEIGQNITITVFPAAGGFPRVISNLPDGFKNHTMIADWPNIRSNDSIDIRSRMDEYEVFAHTNSGFRMLAKSDESPNGFHYGFRADVADINGRFFQPILFLTGLGVTVNPGGFTFDTFFVIDTTINIDTVIITDTFIGLFDTQIDTMVFIDTPQTIVDTTADPPDTTLGKGELWTFPYGLR